MSASGDSARSPGLERTQRALEAGFRAILTLFAAVLGYGLKHIIDVSADAKDPVGLIRLAQFKWPLFAITLAMFSRFVIGTAVHVTYEHISRVGQTSRAIYIQDMMFVASYGLFGIAVCYANTPTGSLSRLLFLHVSAVVWACFDSEVRSFHSVGTDSDWSFYLLINIVVGLLLFLAILFAWNYPQVVYGQSFSFTRDWNWYWITLTFGATATLVFDLRCQLKAIGVR